MYDDTPPSPILHMSENKTNDSLVAWLTDPRSEAYFGTGFNIRADALAYVITGKGTLEEIAQRNGVSKQAVHKHVKRARQIFISTAG